MSKEYILDVGKKAQRNYGIDLLRVLSMCLIIILHILGKGGVLSSAVGSQYAVGWFLEVVAYCSVDCYAIISGYVCYTESEKRHKYAKYIIMWFQVLVYSVGITLLFCFIYPSVIDVKTIIKAFFPVTFSQYWYFTAYTGLFFMIPWLNRFIRRCTSKELTRVVVVIFALFSCYSTVVALAADPFLLKEGYSFLWLTYMYIAGAWIKKTNGEKKLNTIKVLTFIGVFVLITYGIKMCIPIIFNKIFGVYFGENVLINYTSPTVVGMAILLLVLFSRVNLPSYISRMINFVTPAIFGVYLLHVHPLVYQYIISGQFAYIAKMSPWMLPVFVIGWAFIIFIFGILIDIVRIYIFRMLRISSFADRLEKIARFFGDKTVDLLSKLG